jgi:hypothetical protein
VILACDASPLRNATVRSAGANAMPYTLTEAARAVRKDKTTLLRAIRAGKVAAMRDAATRGWLIEPAELHRVYPVIADAVPRDATHEALEAEVRGLRARLDDAHATIADLRRRLDAEADERRRLTAVLGAPKRGWWSWRGR